MSNAAIVSSRRNPRIVDARKLAQRKARLQQGRFLVEGLQIVGMGLEAGARPREAFYCPGIGEHGPASAMADRLRAAGADIVLVTEHVLAALAERDAPQGLVATFDTFGADLNGLAGVEAIADRERAAEGAGDARRPSMPPDVPPDGLVLVLDRLQDPGNLGTLIRTADAVGASAVALLTPCVDPFEPKAVRGSMGSIFSVPLVSTGDANALGRWLKACGLRAVGADAHAGELWGDDALDGGVALVLGNEARGLSADLDPLIESRVRLPLAGKAESLNVAVAGGVLMYTWRRRAAERRE